MHSIDGSQRQKMNKHVQETRLQLSIIGIRNMFGFSISSQEGKWYLEEYFWLFDKTELILSLSLGL